MIEFRSICKSFGGVRVLKDVHFIVTKGHTLGLVGENGAGKSTLMNILGGNLAPTSGEMLLDGLPYAPGSSADAAKCGIAFIHQELNFFPNLTIAENILLTRFPRRAGLLIDRKAAREKARALLEDVGLSLSPDTPMDRLSPGECQLVEVAKALGAEARLIILDEPTSSLSAREAQVLFKLMADLRARGISLIYISHNLDEVLQLSDAIVVLRDGELVSQGPRSEFDRNRMISLMVGRSITQLFPPRNREAADSQDALVLLDVRDLTQPGIAHRITFKLHKKEVLGVAGLMGAGRSELARILFGLDPFARGEVLLNGKPIQDLKTRSRIRRGLAFLTESRREDGLCMEASIAENIALASLQQHERGPLRLLDRRSLSETIASIRSAVRLTPAARDAQPVKTLSGGNQQKVVLAKWLLNKPSVLILDEPTRGIDVGAKYEIYQLIQSLADAGAGVLVISSEIEELMGICDRILVMSNGELRDDIPRHEFDRERILRSALHCEHKTNPDREVRQPLK